MKTQLAILLAWLGSWLRYFACLVGWFVDWLAGCLLGLLTRLLSRSLDCWLAYFFGLLCLLVLICFAWLTCEARAVEHQKLNQTTPYGVVWLSF